MAEHLAAAANLGWVDAIKALAYAQSASADKNLLINCKHFKQRIT